MGFVVQVLSRTGRVMHTLKFDQPSAKIGRAFDCDVLLEDAYVDGHQVEVTNGLHGLQLEVLGDAARTEINDSEVAAGTYPLASGSELLLGKTHLRILSTSHPVPPVRSLQRSDAMLAAWNRPGIVVAITAAFLLVSGIDTYFSSMKEWELSEWLFETVAPLLAALAWVAIAALVTRVVRHDSRMLQHWVVVIGFLLSLAVWNYIEEVLRFNLGDHWLSTGIQVLVVGCLLVALFWLQMRIAFQQKPWVRTFFANALAWGFIGYSFLGFQTFTEEYDPAPDYEAILLPESLRLRGNVTDDEFLNDVQALYEFSEEELE